MLTEVKLTERKAALLKQNNNEKKRNIAFRDTIPALSFYYKRSFNEKWNLIQNQLFKEPPIISLRKENDGKGHACLIETKY